MELHPHDSEELYNKLFEKLIPFRLEYNKFEKFTDPFGHSGSTWWHGFNWLEKFQSTNSECSFQHCTNVVNNLHIWIWVNNADEIIGKPVLLFACKYHSSKKFFDKDKHVNELRISLLEEIRGNETGSS